MKRPTLAAVAAAAVAAVAVFVVAPPAANASPPSALGWWTQRAGAAALGEGAFELATGLPGPESIAAVRIDTLPARMTGVRLVLTAQAGSSADTAFVACPATGPWAPADAGAWAQAPTYDCANAVAARRTVTDTYVVDLTSFSSGGGPIDVVLVPTATEVVPGTGLSPGFTTTFTRADVTIDAPAATTATTAAAAAAGPSRSATSPAPPAPTFTPAPFSPSFSPPVVAPPVTTPTTAVAAPVPTTVSAMIETPMFEIEGGGGSGRPWERLLLLVPLSALAGIAAAATRGATRRQDTPALDPA